MATQKFTGVIPPVVVPDTEDHQLDVASFERSINRMIDAGVDGLFFLGSSGEVVFSTDERRRQIIAEAVRIVDHRVPVLVGIIDTETERMIQQATRALMQGTTSFVIAHRLSTIRQADVILVIDHGKIAEQGTHEELLGRRGAYYELYTSS